MNPRKKPARGDSLTLLIACGRRCCLCFGLNGDFEVKQGQIAHIDHNSENSILENLVFLCLPHHDEYDTISSQTKRIMPGELIEYKHSLEEAISRIRSDPVASPHIRSRQIPSDDQHRTRDIRTLKRLMMVIHTDLLDDFFETGIHGTFLIDVSVSYEQFQIIVNSSSFHIYNDLLRDATLIFSDAWAHCFSYGDYLFPSLTSPNALQFQSPHLVDNPDEVREVFRGFQASMLDAAEDFGRFTELIKHDYPEIDITDTNDAALRLLKSSYFNENDEE